MTLIDSILSYQTIIIVIIILVFLAFIAKKLFSYLKVAVNTKNYAKTKAMTLLFFAFMAITGILSISDRLLISLLDKLGFDISDISQVPQYRWMLILAFSLLAISFILILKIRTHKLANPAVNQIVKNINVGRGNVNITQNYHPIKWWILLSALLALAVILGSYFSVKPDKPSVINNYYGVNPELVEKLKKEPSLKDEVIKRLLINVKEKETELSKRTQAFEDEVKNYQALINSISNKALDKKAKQQLALANWDEAEKLLVEANQKDQNTVAKKNKEISRRNKELAQLNELKLNYPKAIQYYKKALKSQANDLNAWHSLAKLYQRIGNTQQALNAWQQ